MLFRMVRLVAFASAVGASACRRLGTTLGVFTHAQALEFLALHPLNARHQILEA